MEKRSVIESTTAGSARSNRRWINSYRVTSFGLLMLLAITISTTALADHSLTVTHHPPFVEKSGVDLFIEFSVQGGCQDAPLDSPAPLLSPLTWLELLGDRYDNETTVDFPPNDVSLSTSSRLPTRCHPREAHLTYWNSAGRSQRISPDDIHEGGNGFWSIWFTVPGADVTSGTLTYELEVWQKQTGVELRNRVETGVSLNPEGPIDPGSPPQPEPYAQQPEVEPQAEHTVYATYRDSVEVPGESDQTKTKKPKPRKK